MKRCFWVLYLLISINVFAQNRTNIWELGYTLFPSQSCELQYESGEMDTNSVNRIMTFIITNSSICDTSGNLLFYSNGLTIGNRNYDTLQNALDFNPGGLTDSYEPDGLAICQGLIILPDPSNSDRYYLFHESGEYFIANNTLEAQPLNLNYTVIDMNLDGGLGGVVDSLKTIHIIEDTLLNGGLAAVRHGNGRDWWIITHDY